MAASGIRRYAPAVLALLLVALAAITWYNWQQSQQNQYGYGYGPLQDFKDDVAPNAEVASETIGQLEFVDRQGAKVDLAKYRGQNVVLVVTRGYQGAAGNKPPGGVNYGDVCLYCATQTAGLLANYEEFQRRNAEVLVVYPIPTKAEIDRLETFEQAAQRQGSVTDAAPFPLLLDVELKAVDRLGIRQSLAKPATYILDKQGKMRFAYVGQTLADRPSVKAMLAQLDAINDAS